MPSRSARPTRLSIVAASVLAIVVVATVLEGLVDYFKVSLDGDVLTSTLSHPQLWGVALVGIEEAGVPLPVSGDLIIMYAASRIPQSPYDWLMLGVGFELAVLVGSSFLFTISRRWGTRLLYSAAGRALRLNPNRIERAERWFKRWGMWAVIFGRYVPGFRIAVTVVAASFGVGYRVFITGVAISAAVWIAAFMTLGLIVGPPIEQLLGAHQSSSLLVLAIVLLAAVLYLVWTLGINRPRAVTS